MRFFERTVLRADFDIKHNHRFREELNILRKERPNDRLVMPAAANFIFLVVRFLEIHEEYTLVLHVEL